MKKFQLIPKRFTTTVLLNECEEKKKNHFQEAKRQLNIENVTAFAAEELKNELPISDRTD
jgi:hypothetical protein